MRTTFAGVVPLLEIKVDDLLQMDQILTALDLKGRFLSRSARSVPRTKGVVEYRKDITHEFRSKVEFIIR